jgi:scyllo-inositol 2-dehydrogenase (NADP+)
MIDQALLLFGWPDAVTADVQVQRGEARVDDYFDLTFHYGPIRVRLCASTLIAEPRPRFALHGTNGSFVKHGLDTQEAALREADPNAPDFGFDPEEGILTFGDGRQGAVPTQRGCYLSFYRGVGAGITGNAPPPVDPHDAINGLRLIDIARQSSADGRRIVTRDASSQAG